MKPWALLLAIFIVIAACSDHAPSPLPLLPAATDVWGATRILTFDPDAEVVLSASTHDITARFDMEKAGQDIHFFRLELVVLDANRQPLAQIPALNVAPNDLEKLNSKRTGKFSLHFRAEMPADESAPSGETRRKRRDRKESVPPAWAQNARYFLLRAETDRTDLQESLPDNQKQPDPAKYQPKTVPEVIAMAELAVFFVFAFDEAGNGIKQGSGFFIDSSGKGVSNHHVFEGGAQWAIQTIDKRQYRVSEILKISKDNDYVVFRVEAGAPFPFLEIADEKAVKGEEILVIGNPRGLESTVTRGIVSAVRTPMFQIDAAVSPGNSGGPVLNLKGEVLGIATKKILDCENCNFAFNIKVLQLE